MEKKVIYGIAVVIAVLIVGFSAFSINKVSDDGEGGAGGLSASVSPEMAKYAAFEAELACQLLGVDEDDLEGLLAVMVGVVDLAAEHGYTEAEVNANVEQYKGNSDFEKAAFDEMEKQCPSELAAAGATEYTPRT